ncbi:hypothetical protein HAV22_07515 [Massilia sp. TW-1]|uniref:Uncharacterized protein n=1 Tax=Telluria antibiotica TaxID=2717319 RepID=A0ABX0PBI6_9BURK|nr:hypothetical protein [Telluria antibiotica]NIA53500.1 hypothetical protein [Telluria antibiotica]
MATSSHGTARTPVSLANRAVTALFAGCAMAVLAALAPLGAVIFLRDHAIGLLDLYANFTHWGLAVSLLAAATGFVCGADRTIVLSHHLLLTARPRDALLSAGLWLALMLCAAVSTLLS